MKNKIWSYFQRCFATFDFALNYTVLTKSKPFAGLYLCRSKHNTVPYCVLSPSFFLQVYMHFFYETFNKVQFSLLPQGIFLVEPANSYNRVVQISHILERTFKNPVPLHSHELSFEKCVVSSCNNDKLCLIINNSSRQLITNTYSFPFSKKYRIWRSNCAVICSDINLQLLGWFRDIYGVAHFHNANE